MTLAEAKKVAEIITEASKRCGGCLPKQMELVRAGFPEFEWRYEDYTWSVVVMERKPNAELRDPQT